MRHQVPLEDGEEGVFKTIGPLGRLIEQTSLEDFVLLVIAMERKRKADLVPNSAVIIGFND